MAGNFDRSEFYDIVDSLRLELDYEEIVKSERHDTYIRSLARMVLADEAGMVDPKLVEEFIQRVVAWGRSPAQAEVQVAEAIIDTAGSIIHISGDTIPDTISDDHH